MKPNTYILSFSSNTTVHHFRQNATLERLSGKRASVALNVRYQNVCLSYNYIKKIKKNSTLLGDASYAVTQKAPPSWPPEAIPLNSH